MPTYICNNDAARGISGYVNGLYNYNYAAEFYTRIEYSAYNATLYSQHVTQDNNAGYAYRYMRAGHDPISYYNKTFDPEFWYVNQWFSRFDTSAIPSNETVSSVTLLQASLIANSGAADYNTANIEVHGLNWIYSASANSGGLPGVTADYSNWKYFGLFNNKLFTISASVMSTSETNKNHSGTSNANAWINKGGWTYTVGVDSRFITGGFIDRGSNIPAVITLADANTSQSNLTVITTAGGITYNLIVSPR
jgi:hypothetical protein